MFVFDVTEEIAVISTPVISLSAAKWFNTGMSQVMGCQSFLSVLLCMDRLYTGRVFPQYGSCDGLSWSISEMLYTATMYTRKALLRLRCE